MSTSSDYLARIQAAVAAEGITGTDEVIAFTANYVAQNPPGDAASGGGAAAPEEDPRRYGFIGIGTINSAVVRGLMSSNKAALAEGSLLLSPRNAAKAAALAAEFPRHARVAASNQEVIDGSDFVFVATPPGNDNARRSFEGLRFREDQVVISLIAGASAAVLREVCNCPAIVQAFPLPPAEHHMSTTVQWGAHPRAQAVLSRLGKVVVVPDATKALAVASISCVMGDFYARLRAAHEWLVEKGVDPGAASAAVGSYYDTFNFASKDSTTGFQHLVAEQTPGGMNEKNIAFLEEQGSYAALKATLEATRKRLSGE